MTSKGDDDTLPLQGLSQDLSIDITVDEDFIPASQPHSNETSKSTKVSETSPKSDENESTIQNNQPMSIIETSVAPNITLGDNDKSTDFIPETETKKRKMDHTKEESNCKKKLQIDVNLIKYTEDMFDGQNDSSWALEPMKECENLVPESQDTTAKVPETPVPDSKELTKVPETPAPDAKELTKVPESPQNISILSESFPNIDKMGNHTSTPALSLPAEYEKKNEHSVTEIIVNDSAETIDLDASENLSVVQEKNPETEKKGSVEKVDIIDGFTSDAEKFEETEIFEHSSALLFELPAQSKQIEKPQISTISQNMYMQETLDNGEFECKPDKVSCANELELPAVAVLSKEMSEEHENLLDNSNHQNLHFSFKTEPKAASTAQNSPEHSNSIFLQTKKMEFNISVSCMVTMNVKTKEIVQKLILNVNEIQKSKRKAKYAEPISDSTSDKSKRSSMSSSGSVYSDKIGLPFALPKRVSAVSDQTDTSDSEEFSKRLKEGSKVFNRTPWTNEYLVPLKMDELIKASIEEQDLTNSLKPNSFGSPSKQRSKNCNNTHQLKEILESSSSEETSICNGEQTPKTDSILSSENVTNTCEKRDSKINSSDKISEKIMEEKNASPTATEKTNVEDRQDPLESEPNPEIPQATDVQKENEIPANAAAETPIQQEKETMRNEENDRVTLQDGLVVFARWTDRRYYSGTIAGTPKGNRWDIKFDDGTTKAIKENFLIPARWLKKGELVFVFVDDKYISGQITNIKPDHEFPYDVELDYNNINKSVKISDICLTDVMAEIVREKYQPVRTPGEKRLSEIDFDNVLSGKRLREQRTPLRRLSGQNGSETKKKSESKMSKETPQKDVKNDNSEKVRGLRTENGHLIEDKVISTDSPSGNEAGETPFRSGLRETRRKAKPRSLSYDTKEKTKTPKLSEWLTSDGTPIPGPSGVTVKKKAKNLRKKVENVTTSALDCVEEESTPKRAKTNSGGHKKSKYSKK